MKNDLLILFKSFARDSFANEVQKIIAMPNGYYFEYHCSVSYLSNSFVENSENGSNSYKDISKYIRKDSTVLILCAFYPKGLKTQPEEIMNNIDKNIQYLPLRYASIVSTDQNNENITFVLKLLEYPNFNTDISTITKSLLKSEPSLPKYFKCGTPPKSDLKLVFYLEKFSKDELISIVGEKTLNYNYLLEKIKNTSFSNNDDFLVRFYFIPVLKILDKASGEEKKYKKGFIKYNRNEEIIIEMHYQPISNEFNSISDNFKSVNLYAYNDDSDKTLLKHKEIETSDHLKTLSFPINSNNFQKYCELQFSGKSIDKKEFKSDLLTNISGYNTLNSIGTYSIKIKKSRLYNSKKELYLTLIRLIQSLPIFAIIYKDRILMNHPEYDSTFIFVIVTLVIISIIIPSKSFIGDGWKDVFERNKS